MGGEEAEEYNCLEGNGCEGKRIVRLGKHGKDEQINQPSCFCFPMAGTCVWHTLPSCEQTTRSEALRW